MHTCVINNLLLPCPDESSQFCARGGGGGGRKPVLCRRFQPRSRRLINLRGRRGYQALSRSVSKGRPRLFLLLYCRRRRSTAAAAAAAAAAVQRHAAARRKRLRGAIAGKDISRISETDNVTVLREKKWEHCEIGSGCSSSSSSSICILRPLYTVSAAGLRGLFKHTLLGGQKTALSFGGKSFLSAAARSRTCWCAPPRRQRRPDSVAALDPTSSRAPTRSRYGRGETPTAADRRRRRKRKAREWMPPWPPLPLLLLLITESALQEKPLAQRLESSGGGRPRAQTK